MIITIINDRQVERLIEVAKTLPATGKIYEVVIRERRTSRSLAQQGLKWIWCKEIGQYTGESIDEVNHRLKRTHLLPIFEHAESGHDQYKPTLEALREVYRHGTRSDAELILNMIVSGMRTEEASVKEMTEYLVAIEHEAINNGIMLSKPDDYALAIYGRRAR